MEEKVCMFTGHRKIPYGKLNGIKRLLLREVQALILSGTEEFITGGALGFDTVAAECILYLKKQFPNVKLKLYLPCRDQDKNWNLNNRARYDRILNEADDIIYTGEVYSYGCMHERNRRMVQVSDICLAFLEKDDGGTAYTVNYAKESGLTVINLNDML